MTNILQIEKDLRFNYVDESATVKYIVVANVFYIIVERDEFTFYLKHDGAITELNKSEFFKSIN